MSYKKYIKRGNKIYGPYIYKSERRGEKVVTQYMGKGEIDKKRRNKLKFLLVIPLLVIVALIFFKTFLTPTGKIVLEPIPIYKINETIMGDVKINLNRGELIPADSLILLKLDGQEKEISLSQITSMEPIEGDFYAENTGLSGHGLGYGFPGEKKIYPTISFKILVYEISEDIEESEVSQESNEENITKAVEEEITSEPTEETTQAEEPALEITEQQAEEETITEKKKSPLNQQKKQHKQKNLL